MTKRSASLLSLPLFFLLFSQPLLSQNAHLVDSLRQRIALEKNDSSLAILYNTLADEYYDANLDSAEYLLQKVYFFARKSGCTTCLVEYYRGKGFAKNRLYQIEEALELYDEAQKLAEKIKNQCLIATIYSQKGGALNRKKDYTNALVWLQKAVDLGEKSGCSDKIFGFNYNLFIALSNMGRRQECVVPLAKAIEIAERSGNPVRRQLSYFAMANELLNAGNWQSAEPFAQKSLDLSRSLGDKYNEAKALYMMGKAASIKEEFKLQYDYLQQARAAFGEGKDMFMKANLWSTSAMCAASNERYGEALELLAIAYPLAQKIGSMHDLTNCLRAYGKVYQMQNDPEKAESYFLEAVRLADQSPANLQARTLALTNLHQLYQQYGLWEKAYKSYKRLWELSDSLNNNEQRVQLAVVETELRFHKERAEQERLLSLRERDMLTLRNEKLQTDFHLAEQSRQLLTQQLESEKQAASLFALQASDQEKALLNTALDAKNKAQTAELDLKTLQINREFWVRWTLGVLALAIFAGLFWFFKRRRQRDVLALRTDLAQDLHDDLGSEMSAISLASFSAARSGDPVRMGEALQNIAGQSSRLVEDMRDIVWSIHPDNDSLEKIAARMRQYAAQMLEPQDVDLHFQVAANALPLKMQPEARKHLYLFFKEAVHNIARHAHCSRVDIGIRRENGSFVLEIRDNGQGFDPTAPIKTTGGNGLRNLRNRAEVLGGKLQVESRLETGTILQLVAPLT